MPALNLWCVFILSFICLAGYSVDAAQQVDICTPSDPQSAACGEPTTDPLLKLNIGESEKKDTSEGPTYSEGSPGKEQKTKETFQTKEQHSFTVHFFWGEGCPHCEKEKPFLAEMTKQYPGMLIKDYEVWYNKANARLLFKVAEAYGMKASAVPITFVGENAIVGFSEQAQVELEKAIQRCAAKKCINPLDKIQNSDPTKKPIQLDLSAEKSDGKSDKDAQTGRTGLDQCLDEGGRVTIPLIGTLDVSKISLPFMTVVIAGLDSFNPCAFFILLSLLGLLVYAQSRAKMFVIGSVFVFFSGVIYFLFMSAWLNFFLVMGHVAVITTIAGIVSIAIAAINIKDFFLFKKGISLTIPESAKPKLFEKMRRLMKSTSLVSMLFGTTVLAIAANSYELLCTAGFPMVFTRILTLNNLSTFSYYLYLILYNVVYIIPLAVIVVVFTITLGKRKLTEWQGRVLKLVSGTMMLGLGIVLLLNPAFLNNILVSFGILLGALTLSGAIATITRKIG